VRKFAGMVGPENVSFTGIDGKNHIISTAHPNNERIRELMRATRKAFVEGDESEGQLLWQELTDIADIPASITKASMGRVEVKDDEVYFDGEVLHNSITRRIMWCIQEGEEPSPYMAFLDNLMENPSKRAVDELFDFLEACNMGVTDDGYLIAYKRVRDDYRDIHSATLSNHVGAVLRMPRNRVDEDKDRTCSDGLHFCSFSYLPHFGSGPGSRVVIVKINPKDVVAIPSDYRNAKGRTCAYEVIGEYTGDDLADILSAKPIWNTGDVRSSFGNESYGEEKSTLERLIRAISDADYDARLNDIDGATTLGEIPFAIRVELRDIIDSEFMVELDYGALSDDDNDLETIADIIESDGRFPLWNSGGDGFDDGFDDEVEDAEDLVEVEEPAAPVVTANDNPSPATSGQTTVFLYPITKGSDTRWVAECPDCNEGNGWKVDYAQKRDARRGIRRALGENVAIVERDQ
jgi:hypothetical protein